jgi:hypothetical protein
MHHLVRQHIGFLFAMTSFCMVGCTLDEPAQGEQQPALSLTYDLNLSLTNLHWDKVNVTGFKEYIILQSSTPIPNNPTPVVNQDVTILKRIDEVDVNSFAVASSLLTSQVCYKVYCAVDDRFLYSPTVCIDQQIEVIQGFYDRACHTAERFEMTMFDRINKRLATYNYNTGSVINEVTEPVLNFPSLEMTTYETNTNVFAYDQSPGSLRRYNLPALTSSHSKNFTQVLWAANVHDQFVFAATDEFNKGFQILNRSNLSVVKTRTGMTGNQNVAVFPGNPMTVLTIGTSQAIKYTIDSAGEVISEAPVPGRISQPDLQYACAEGNDLFICGREGTIIKRNGEMAGFLNTDPNAFVMLTRLSPDETKAVYIINENGVQRLEIADLSQLPAVTIVSSFELPTLTYGDIIPEANVIYLLGTAFNGGGPESFILKYPW